MTRCTKIVGIFLLLVLPLVSANATNLNDENPVFTVNAPESFTDNLKVVVTTFDQQTVNIRLLNEKDEIVFKYKVPLYGELVQTINTETYPEGAYRLVVLVGDEEQSKDLKRV